MPINTNLVSAPLNDLRRLSLLAELAAKEQDVDPETFVPGLKEVFRGLPGCLEEDVKALSGDGYIVLDDSIAMRKEVSVTEDGRTLVRRLQESVNSNWEVRTAVVAAMVLYYMHLHKDRASSTTTESLRDAGITVFGSPLPDGCVEEALKELHDLGMINGTKGHQGGRIVRPEITVKGSDLLRSGRPVLLPDNDRGGASPVFNTTINGGIQGQNIAVASQGDVFQDVTTVINVDQAMADLRIAVDALDTALNGYGDLQKEIAQLREQLNEAEDQDRKSLMARALSDLKRFAQKAADKGIDQAVTMAVTEAAKLLLNAIGS